MSKQELITTPISPLSLSTESCVKFEGKINTNDLIDAVLFEQEEKLKIEEKQLLKEINETEKIKDNLESKEYEELENYQKNFNTKKYDQLLNLLNKLQSKKKFKLHTYHAKIKNKKIEINSQIIYSKNGYTNNLLELEDTMDIPKNLLEIIKEKEVLNKKLPNLKNKLEECRISVKELPHLKKKIKAEFVKSMVKGDELSSHEMLEQLRSALLEVKKCG